MAEPHARSLDEIRQLLRELEVSADDAWNGASANLNKLDTETPRQEHSKREDFGNRLLGLDLPATPPLPTPHRLPYLALPRFVEEQRRELDSAARMRRPAGDVAPSRLGWLSLFAATTALAAAVTFAFAFLAEQRKAEPEHRLVQGPRPANRPLPAVTAPETVAVSSPPAADARQGRVVSTPPSASPPPAEPFRAPARAAGPPEQPARPAPPAPELAAARPEVSPVAAPTVEATAAALPAPAKSVEAAVQPVPAADPTPRLILPEEIAAPAGARTAIGLAFLPAAEADGHDVLVSGLEPSAVIESGVELVRGTWLLRAAELGEVTLRRAPDAPERLTLELELRQRDGAVISRRSVVITVPAGARRPVEAEPSAQSTRMAEAGLLLQEGRELVRRADLANARMFLQQAAELGSAEAALELAETYARGRKQSEVAGAAPEDRAQALAWYERAAALGSEEARRRMVRMTGR